MKSYKLKLGTALSAIFFLTACGGSSSSSSPSPATSTAIPAVPVVSVDPTPAAPVTSEDANPSEPATAETAPPPRNILEAVSQATSAPATNSDNAVATTDSDNAVSASPLSGVAAKGIIGGARIVVFDALQSPEGVGEEDGPPLLGETITNSDGTYSLSLQTTETTSDYLVIGAFLEDATMICDAPSGCFDGVAFGEPMTLGESEDALWAIFPKPAAGEAAIANINLFTNLQLYRMLGLAYDVQTENNETDEPITLDAQHFAPAFEFVSNAFGLEADLFHTIPYVDATKPIGSSNRNAVNMGLLSAGFLEAGIQAKLVSRGEEADLHGVLNSAGISFLLPAIFLEINEDDENNNQRTVSIEDIFEGALKTAELNTAQNNSLSSTINFLTEQNAVIDALPHGARLETDGNYPEALVDTVPEEPAIEEETVVEEEAIVEEELLPDEDSYDEGDTTSNETCRPKLSPNISDEIVLLSGYEGTAISSVAVSSLDRVTDVTRVRIEAGETPLYIIASTYENMVWSIEGDTDRVASFVATKGRIPGFAGAGVVGLPNEKVEFIDHDCIEYFTSATARDARRAQTQYEGFFEREIDHILASYTLSSVAIPSGEMIGYNRRKETETIAIANGQTQITADNGIKFNIESQTEHAEKTALFRFTQEGLATLPINDVVAPGNVQTYDVFPSHAGLVQLLSSGHIEYQGLDSGYTATYFIRNTFMRFPAELAGAESVKFILGTGVGMPGGDIGHSRVFSEETGECLLGLC